MEELGQQERKSPLPGPDVQLASVDDAGQLEHDRKPASHPDTLFLWNGRVFPRMLAETLKHNTIF